MRPASASAICRVGGATSGCASRTRAIDGRPVRICYWPTTAESTPPRSWCSSTAVDGWSAILDTHGRHGPRACGRRGRGGGVGGLRLAARLESYPAAVDDVGAATRWVAEHAEGLLIRPAQRGGRGDFAGGNLAAVGAQLAWRRGRNLRAQPLWYPATTWDTTLPLARGTPTHRLRPRLGRQLLPAVRQGDTDLKNPTRHSSPGPRRVAGRRGARLHRGGGLRPAARRRDSLRGTR